MSNTTPNSSSSSSTETLRALRAYLQHKPECIASRRAAANAQGCELWSTMIYDRTTGDIRHERVPDEVTCTCDLDAHKKELDQLLSAPVEAPAASPSEFRDIAFQFHVWAVMQRDIAQKNREAAARHEQAGDYANRSRMAASAADHEMMATRYTMACETIEALLNASSVEAPQDWPPIDNGNIAVFCDYVNKDLQGCLRGAGHNGPHAHIVTDRYPQSPVMLVAADQDEQT